MEVPVIRCRTGERNMQGTYGRCTMRASKLMGFLTALTCAAACLSLGSEVQAYDILDIAGPPYASPPTNLPNPAPSPNAPLAPYAQAAPAPAPTSWAFGRGSHLRLEGGAGYSNGGTNTTVSSPGVGSVSTNLFGGGGLAAEAAIWWDGILYPTISLGAQYLHFDHSGSVTVNSEAGPIFGLTSGQLPVTSI